MDSHAADQRISVPGAFAIASTGQVGLAEWPTIVGNGGKTPSPRAFGWPSIAGCHTILCIALVVGGFSDLSGGAEQPAAAGELRWPCMSRPSGVSPAAWRAMGQRPLL